MVAMQLWAHTTSGRRDVISSQFQAASRGSAARSAPPIATKKTGEAVEVVGDTWWMESELHYYSFLERKLHL